MNKFKFLKFSLVGALGFGVDIGSTYTLFNFLDISPHWARLPAWLLAVTTTYIFNVIFTFSKSRIFLTDTRIFVRRYFLYMASQLGGGVVNVCTYSLLIIFLNTPVYFAIIAGTFLGLIFNYFGASLVIEGHMVSHARDRR